MRSSQPTPNDSDRSVAVSSGNSRSGCVAGGENGRAASGLSNQIPRAMVVPHPLSVRSGPRDEPATWRASRATAPLRAEHAQCAPAARPATTATANASRQESWTNHRPTGRGWILPCRRVRAVHSALSTGRSSRLAGGSSGARRWSRVRRSRAREHLDRAAVGVFEFGAEAVVVDRRASSRPRSSRFPLVELAADTEVASST